MKSNATERPCGAELIYNERVRQVKDKGYDANHDAIYKNGELAAAGASYAILAFGQAKARAIGIKDDVQAVTPPRQWPWRGAAWKPSNSRLQNLVRAGALITAEIDRLLAEGETLPSESEQTEIAKPE